MEDHLNEYVYEPLKGSDTIRVLRLHQTQDSLECDLQQIKYADGGYQAISYVWGTQEQLHKMIVRNDGGKNLGYTPLTTNLQHALCDLRDSNEVESKVFWIDQICINQRSDENNRQVPLMGKIYQSASRVIVYAGSALADRQEEEQGIALMRLLNEHYDKNVEMLSGCSDMLEAKERRLSFPVQTLPVNLTNGDGNRGAPANITYITEGWRGLLEMVYGEWTERLWIVQELLHNKELFVLRGLRILPWDCVALVPMLYDTNPSRVMKQHVHHFWRENLANSERTPRGVADSYFAIWSLRQQQRKGLIAPRENLLQNLYWYDYLKCSDPRDRIYAMLSISRDATALGIIPDYSETSSVNRVYLDASVRILKAASNLEMLPKACRWAKFETRLEDSFHRLALISAPDCPSWALRAYHYPLPDAPNGHNKPHPRTSLLSIVRFLQNDSVLVLKGCVVDSALISTPLTWTLAPASVGVRDTPYFRTWSQRLLGWRAVLQHFGVTVENAASLCRTIVASPTRVRRSLKGRSNNESHAFAFLLYYRWRVGRVRHSWPEDLDSGMTTEFEQCDQLVLDLATLLLEKPSLDSFNSSTRLTAEEMKWAKDIESNAVMHGRSFCTTEKGRMCNAMHQAEEGDLIAAFQGSESLWLLRPVGERYRLIGDVYVDGLMDGQAYEGLDSNEVDYDIELI
jgi:hypothetical protein